MIKQVDIRTTVKEYKSKTENQGKLAIFDIEKSKIILEGEEADWNTLEEKVEEANKNSEVYYLVIVPHSKAQIRAFSWR